MTKIREKGIDARRREDRTMMAAQSNFTVVIPLYNKRRFVRRTVDSVLRQSITDFKLIVVDDGSTDGSCEELTDISDARFELLRQSNAGPAQARNTGISHARSEWIALLDADDLWLPGHLEELEKIIERHPDAGVVATGCAILPVGASLKDVPNVGNARIQKVDYFRRAANQVGLVFTATPLNVLHPSSVAIKREVFRAAGGFNDYKRGEDTEYWVRLALDYPVAISTRITAVYHRGTGGIMDQQLPSSMRMLPAARSRPELSPAIALACEALEKNEYSDKVNSIRAYIDSRILYQIKRALVAGNVARARSLFRLSLIGRAS